ncbi:cytochrome P450 3A14-like [Centruroides sculpturatus]|uniref:cytochrome P450 3A14-like n=1 Tax=Centruroides sculpturatus TaxID=218467 RepID=UPI000C6ED223|nr:cytochrome P450 3A14-like [Centruroides sculpturatus]
MFPCSLVISFIIIICLTFLWLRWRTNKLNLFKNYGIPGPKPDFFTGNFKEFQLERTKCVEKWSKKYGKIFGFFLGAKPYIMCSDTEFLKIMQIKEFKRFSIRDRILPDIGIPHESVKHVIGLQKGIKWKNLRSVLTACFSSQKIKMMSVSTQDLIANSMKKIEKENGKPFDALENYKNLVFNIMLKLVMGVKFNEESEEYNKIVKSLNFLLQKDISSTSSVISMYFPEFEPIPTYFRLLFDIIKSVLNFDSIRFLFNTCKNIIAVRKQLMNNQQDILQSLLNAEISYTDHNKKLTSSSVLVTAVVMITSGYETMSSSLGWCTYFLAKNQEIQEKARQEINKNIEKDKDINYADVMKLHYLDQIMSETLRLSSLSVLLISRAGEQDFEYKGTTIPKHVGIFVPVPILHRDPNYWQEPDKFDPDRFSPENKININPMTYQPFGAGPRNCVAYRMARTVMKLIMANLIRSFVFEAYECERSVVKHSIFSTRKKDSILIKATPISSN